jgi:iron complex transport system substrate-binding protein
MTVLERLAAIFCLLLCAGAAHALQITDQRGVTVQFAQSPQRIVSLLPSLTESVCALSQCARLVGVDRYSNYPDSVKALPKVGGGIDPNVEAVIALRPDVVLLSVSSRASARLESLGMKVVALEPKNHADVRRVLLSLQQLLEVSGDNSAERVWREIDAGVSAAAQSLPPRARGIRVYFEVSRGPYGAGETSFIGETLQRLQVRNIVPATLGPFPRLNPEFVVRADPQIIMIGNRSMQDRVEYPGWKSIDAVRHNRVCVFNNDDADVLVRPGPRMAEAARIMARCITDKVAQ